MNPYGLLVALVLGFGAVIWIYIDLGRNDQL